MTDTRPADVGAARPADLRRLDFGLLMVLVEGVRRRKLTEVAAVLGVTQAAVSHSVSRLRAIFDDPLFLRRPHGVEPTARAVALADAAAEVLDAASRLLGPAGPFEPAALERTLRIAALDYDAGVLSHALGAIMEEAPRARFAIRALAREPATAALEDGTIDLAVGFRPGPPGSLGRAELWSETYRVVAARGHPRLGAALTLDDYCRERHVVVAPGGTPRGIADTALEAVGRSRMTVVTTAGFLPALVMVATTDLLATVPSRLALAHAAGFGLAVHEPPMAIRPFTVSAAWHRRADADPAVGWLVGRMREAAG